MHLNYHHLHCFWVIADEGSITRAARRLHVTHSTLSVQLRALEDVLGKELFERRGRGLVLTPFGDEIRVQASEIFRIGREIVDGSRRNFGELVRLRVGVLASLPKSITCRLLESIMDVGRTTIALQHGPLDRLLENLATGRLHVVLTDQAPPQGTNLRLHTHPLGETELLLYGTTSVAGKLRGSFPGSLDGAPLLLPPAGSQLRRQIDAWLGARDLHVRVAAELDDAGALRAFGLRGWGLFPVRSALASEVNDVRGTRRVGRLDGVRERYFAVTRDRAIRHIATAKLVELAREHLAK
jgi:LysR family transcriptional activator of nhaA